MTDQVTPDDEDLEELPASTYELIDLLDRSHPHRCVRPGETMEQALIYAGYRQLIDELVQWKKDEIDSEARAETKE